MKLRDWLIKKRVRHQTFAKEIEVSRAYLSSIITGKKVPSKKIADRIEKVTSGQITSLDVLTRKALGYEGKRKTVMPTEFEKINNFPYKKKISLL